MWANNLCPTQASKIPYPSQDESESWSTPAPFPSSITLWRVINCLKSCSGAITLSLWSKHLQQKDLPCLILQFRLLPPVSMCSMFYLYLFLLYSCFSLSSLQLSSTRFHWTCTMHWALGDRIHRLIECFYFQEFKSLVEGHS